MFENNKEMTLTGLNKDSFAPVVAALLAILAGVIGLVFAIMNAFAAGSEQVMRLAVEHVLFVIAGAADVAAAFYFIAAIFLTRALPHLKIMLTFAGAAYAPAFLLRMIAGVIRSGQYTNVIEILLFVFELVMTGALVTVFVGFLNRKKSLIAMYGLTAVAVLCAFIPVMTGSVPILTAFKIYIPSCVTLAAIATLAVGADNAEANDAKR